MLGNSTFSNLFTFSRTSPATDLDVNGVLVSSTNDTLRNGYVNGQRAGWLIEGAATNALLQSESFDSGNWTKTNSTITANTTATADPMGGNAADKLCEDGNTADHLARQAYNASNTTLTFSVFAKAAERSLIMLEISNNATGSANARFDLLAGTANAPNTSGDFSAVSALIQPVGNGWYRCILTATKGNTNTTAGPYVHLYNGGLSYQGTAGWGVYLWGAQMEQSSIATSYIPTAGSAASRAADSLVLQGAAFTQAFGNVSQGWVVVDSSIPVLSSLARLFEFGVGTSGTGFNAVFSSGNWRFGGTQGDLIGPVASAGTNRVGILWRSGYVAISVNGSVPVSASNSVPAGVNRLDIGNRAVGDRPINGRILGFSAGSNGTISDATFQKITALGADIDGILRG